MYILPSSYHNFHAKIYKDCVCLCSIIHLQIAQNAPLNVRIGSAGQSEKLLSKKISGKMYM